MSSHDGHHHVGRGMEGGKEHFCGSLWLLGEAWMGFQTPRLACCNFCCYKHLRDEPVDWNYCFLSNRWKKKYIHLNGQINEIWQVGMNAIPFSANKLESGVPTHDLHFFTSIPPEVLCGLAFVVPPGKTPSWLSIIPFSISLPEIKVTFLPSMMPFAPWSPPPLTFFFCLFGLLLDFFALCHPLSLSLLLLSRA